MQTAFEGLELYDGKLSRTVLRGQGAIWPCATRCSESQVFSFFSLHLYPRVLNKTVSPLVSYQFNLLAEKCMA